MLVTMRTILRQDISMALLDLLSSGKYLRYAVLLVCTAVVVVQLHECISKLVRPPVSTHMKVVVNRSLTYPAVTVCRSPPYKYNVLENYNLSYPRQFSDWKDFPFGNISLMDLWLQATYSEEEVFSLYALNYLKDFVHMNSRLYLEWGQCHTLLPRNSTRASGRDVGYRVILYHQKAPSDAALNSSFRDGWNVYVHPSSDPWIESVEDAEGLVETLYLEVGEELHANIVVQEYKHLSRHAASCNNSYSYSQVKCEEECWMRTLAEDVGCSTPWIHDVNFPPCGDFTSMKNSITGYLYKRSCKDEGRCPRACRELRFVPYVTSRRTTLTTTGRPSSYSTLKLFYSSRLVQVIEEHLTYDWTVFLSDLGGSLGFLLGLSVLGIVGVAQNILKTLLGAKRRRFQQESNNLKTPCVTAIDFYPEKY